jgi:hypothetical protein
MAAEKEDIVEGAGFQMVPKAGAGLIAVAQQREIAEVQSKMIVARMNPRNEKKALDRILQSCTRLTLAEKALYTYSRGGTDITGPSIRLAEAIAQYWQNFEFGIRELEQRDGESTVEAYAWDVENNVSQRKAFQVPHIRHTKKGSYKLSDPRDIYELVANLGARRMRACILGVIPGDIVESAQKQCEETLRTQVKVTPERIKNMLTVFAGEFAVTKEMIEKRIQRHVDVITPALLVQLTKIYNSLKDGMSVVSDWFETDTPTMNEPERGTLNISDLKPKETPPAKPPDPAPVAAQETPKSTGKGKRSQDPPPSPRAQGTYATSEPDPYTTGELREPGQD